MAEQKTATGSVAKTDSNGSLDFKGIDYGNLIGDSFVALNRLIASLRHDDKYTFEVMQCQVIKKERFTGMQGSPVDAIGVKVTNNIPLMTTNCRVKDALEINGKLDEKLYQEDRKINILGGQFQTEGRDVKRYFLIKKSN